MTLTLERTRTPPSIGAEQFFTPLYGDLSSPSGAVGQKITELCRNALAHWESSGERIFRDAVDDESELASALVHGAAMEKSTSNLSALIDRIDQIGAEDEVDECGPLRPSTYALYTAKTLINDAATAAPSRFVFPLGNVTSDYDGGILIEWKTRDKAVHLAVRSSAEKGNYLYHEENRQYAVERDIDGDCLLRWLERLIAAD